MMCCRGLARALTVAIILLIALPCRAADLYHHDLSSLAYLADAVVRARVTSGLHERMGVRTHEVLEVYAGPLAVGEVFEAPWGSLVLERLWGAGDDWHVDDEVVVFLVRDASGPRLVPSGLRVFVDGRAYRFEQHRNPGPFEPTPQGRDPYDVLGDPRAGEGLTREELLAALPAAIARAAAFRAAIAEADSPAARDRLLEFVGPALGDDDLEPENLNSARYGFEDVIAGAALTELSRRGDVTRLLDGVTRIHGGVDLRFLRLDLDSQALVRKAGDRKLPVHLRVAALKLVDEAVFQQRRVDIAVARLLEDESPLVRAAAIAAGPHGEDPRWRAAVIRRARVETDPRALLELVNAARWGDYVDHLPIPAAALPIVVARRHARSVELTWADPWTGWGLTSMVIKARARDGTRRELPVTVQRGQWSSGVTAGVRAHALFDPPLPPGPATLTVVATLESRREQRTFELELRPLGSVVEEEASPDAPREERAARPEATDVPSGCSCAAGAGGASGSRSALGLLALGLLALGRRRG